MNFSPFILVTGNISHVTVVSLFFLLSTFFNSASFTTSSVPPSIFLNNFKYIIGFSSGASIQIFFALIFFFEIGFKGVAGIFSTTGSTLITA